MDTEKSIVDPTATNSEPAIDENMPRGWCVEVSGLLEDRKARIVDDWGYGFRDEAQRAAAELAEDFAAQGIDAKVKAVAAPKRVRVARLRKAEEGFEAVSGDVAEWHAAVAANRGSEHLAKDVADGGAACEGRGVLLDETMPDSKKTAIAIACAVAAVVFAIGSAIFALGAGGSQQEAPVETPSKTEAPAEKASLVLRVELVGWDEDTSTPVIARIESDDSEVDFYHAFAANKAETVEVLPGAYTVSFISPVNADGSIYEIYGATGAEKVTVGAGGASISVKFDPVPLNQVTQEQFDQIFDALKDAVAKGDSTLGGSAGKEIVKRAAGNAANAPAADKDAIDRKKEEASAAVTDDSRRTAGSEGSGSTTPQGSSGDASGAGASGGGSGQSSPAPSPAPSAPEHVHDFSMPVTQTVHHDAVYDTVWHDAVVQQVPIYGSMCATCGAISPSGEHSMHHALNGESDRVLNNVVVGYSYQEVSPAWEETVIATPAWDETVTVGYRCSCGAMG